MTRKKINYLILLGFFTAAGTLSGCQTKAERAVAAALAQAQQTADLNKSIQDKNEAAKVAVARLDYSRQIHYFNALAGTFVGPYMTDQIGVEVPIFRGNFQVTLTTNSPDTTDKHRVATEAEIISQTEAISFSVIVTETDENGEFLTSCQVDVVRPELVDGRIRFSCTGEARKYALYLDKVDGDDGTPIISRSQSVSRALLQQTMSTVGFMSLEIQTSLGKKLKGSLKRTL